LTHEQDHIGIQRKVWNGEWPDDKAPPGLSIALAPKPQLPYPIQYGAGLWLSASSSVSMPSNGSA
jgi:hypothetical protein